MGSVDVVKMIIGIQFDESRCATSIPCDINGVLCSWAVVINFKFVSMRMAVELSANDLMESVDDATIFARPERVTTAAARWKMLQDVNSFVSLFGSEESVVQPLHVGLSFCSTVQHPPVVNVAIVVVKSDQSESGTEQDGVITSSTDGGDSIA